MDRPYQRGSVTQQQTTSGSASLPPLPTRLDTSDILTSTRAARITLTSAEHNRHRRLRCQTQRPSRDTGHSEHSPCTTSDTRRALAISSYAPAQPIAPWGAVVLTCLIAAISRRYRRARRRRRNRKAGAIDTREGGMWKSGCGGRRRLRYQQETSSLRASQTPSLLRYREPTLSLGAPPQFHLCSRCRRPQFPGPLP